MNLELRTEKINKVRKMNKVPGVIFGRSLDSISIQANDKELKDALKKYGKNMTFKVKLEGKTHNVFISQIESLILNPQEIIHFVLRRVDAKENVSAMIPIVLFGREVFHDTMLYLQQELNEILAEYKPSFGISKIEIDVSEMKLGDEILVKDIVIDKHITLKEDPEQVIVVLKEVHIKPEPTEEDELESEEEVVVKEVE